MSHSVESMRTGTSSHSKQMLQTPDLTLVCSSQHTMTLQGFTLSMHHISQGPGLLCFSCSAAPGVLDLISLPVCPVPHVLQLVAGSACNLVILSSPLHTANDMLFAEQLGAGHRVLAASNTSGWYYQTCTCTCQFPGPMNFSCSAQRLYMSMWVSAIGCVP